MKKYMLKRVDLYKDKVDYHEKGGWYSVRHNAEWYESEATALAAHKGLDPECEPRSCDYYVVELEETHKLIVKCK